MFSGAELRYISVRTVLNDNLSPMTTDDKPSVSFLTGSFLAYTIMQGKEEQRFLLAMFLKVSFDEKEKSI